MRPPVHTVLFLGFAPGFAYLGGLPEQLVTPRRATPARARPGRQCRDRRGAQRRVSAIDARRLEPDRPDRPGALRRRTGAAVAAGARSRWCGSCRRDDPRRRRRRPPDHRPGRRSARVDASRRPRVRPGRPRGATRSRTCSPAMGRDAAALELTVVGPTVTARDDGLIGLAGADLGARVRGGRRLATGRSHRIRGGRDDRAPRPRRRLGGCRSAVLPGRRGRDRRPARARVAIDLPRRRVRRPRGPGPAGRRRGSLPAAGRTRTRARRAGLAGRRPAPGSTRRAGGLDAAPPPRPAGTRDRSRRARRRAVAGLAGRRSCRRAARGTVPARRDRRRDAHPRRPVGRRPGPVGRPADPPLRGSSDDGRLSRARGRDLGRPARSSASSSPATRSSSRRRTSRPRSPPSARDATGWLGAPCCCARQPAGTTSRARPVADREGPGPSGEEGGRKRPHPIVTDATKNRQR